VGKKQGKKPDGKKPDKRADATAGDKIAAGVGTILGLWFAWMTLCYLWDSFVESFNPW